MGAKKCTPVEKFHTIKEFNHDINQIHPVKVEAGDGDARYQH
jgi:hypothetical protein